MVITSALHAVGHGFETHTEYCFHTLLFSTFISIQLNSFGFVFSFVLFFSTYLYNHICINYVFYTSLSTIFSFTVSKSLQVDRLETVNVGDIIKCVDEMLLFCALYHISVILLGVAILCAGKTSGFILQNAVVEETVKSIADNGITVRATSYSVTADSSQHTVGS